MSLSQCLKCADCGSSSIVKDYCSGFADEPTIEKIECAICKKSDYCSGFVAPRGERTRRFAQGCVGVEGDNNFHSDDCMFKSGMTSVHVRCAEKSGDLISVPAGGGIYYFISKCCQQMADGDDPETYRE